MFSSTSAAKTSVAGLAIAAAVALPLMGGSAAFAVGDATFPPTANNDHYWADQDTQLVVDVSKGLLANDSSGGNFGLAVQGVLQGVGGAMVASNDGSFTFLPDAGFVGQVHLTYVDSAGGYTSNFADIYIDVVAAPIPAAIVNPDVYETFVNSPLVVDAAAGVLANDVGAYQVNQQYDATGEILMNVAGDFVYTPALDFVGTKTFTYDALSFDGVSVSAATTVTITVKPIVIIPTDPGDPGDNPGDPGDNPGNPGDNPGNPGDNPGNPGDNPGNPGDNPGNPGDNPGNPGDNPGNAGGDNPGNAGDQPSTPAPIVPGTPGGSDRSDLPTLAYTGAGGAAGWLALPALALFAFGGAGVWFARRRTITE